MPARHWPSRKDGTFAGYASLFGKTDLGRDMVMPGAFRASLTRRGAAGVKMLYQHDLGVSRIRQILTRAAKSQVEAELAQTPAAAE